MFKTETLVLIAVAVLLWINRSTLQRYLYKAGEATLGDQNPVDPPGGEPDPTFGVGNPYEDDPIYDPYDPLGMVASRPADDQYEYRGGTPGFDFGSGSGAKLTDHGYGEPVVVKSGSITTQPVTYLGTAHYLY